MFRLPMLLVVVVPVGLYCGGPWMLETAGLFGDWVEEKRFEETAGLVGCVENLFEPESSETALVRLLGFELTATGKESISAVRPSGGEL